jgi:catechol 2,3-dioxygenase-like lactoylglutathione lyase family enzyme
MTALPPAVNQHFALRTTRIEAMLGFYCGQLGFHLSDRVLDNEGRLRACFLRTDSLHHSLALFGAPVTCFDHQSFESPAWSDLKD